MNYDGKAIMSLTDSDASSMHSKLYLLFYVYDNTYPLPAFSIRSEIDAAYF